MGKGGGLLVCVCVEGGAVVDGKERSEHQSVSPDTYIRAIFPLRVHELHRRTSAPDKYSVMSSFSEAKSGRPPQGNQYRPVQGRGP